MTAPNPLITSVTDTIVALSGVLFSMVMVPLTAQALSVPLSLVTATVYSELPESPVNRSQVSGSTDLSMVQPNVRVNVVFASFSTSSS